MRTSKLFLFSITLLLSFPFLFLAPSALAASIFNRTPWPEVMRGLTEEEDNTGYQDAAHPCFRTQGRSFKVTHGLTVKLSGISLYVYVPGRNERQFDRDVFRLSLKDSNNQLLTTNISPAYAGIIYREDSGSPTFEVFFPLDFNVTGGLSYIFTFECLTDDPDLYRVSESSRVPDGEAAYYDSTNSQTKTYYMSGRKILYTTFAENFAVHFPALTASPSLSLANSQLLIATPKYHPVIIVHGMGGAPDAFLDDSRGMNYKKLLTGAGYPENYILLYNYGYKDDGRGRWVYNYQGDVREIALGMESAVKTLSEKHKADGGDGKVDILAHSLGNLVTKQYLVTHKDNHHVRKYIAVGAPFKGSWIMDFDQGVKEIPGVGKYAESSLSLLGRSLAFKFKILNKDQPLSQDSPAAQQVRSDSAFLKELNAYGRFPSDVQVSTILGDINATFEQKIFNLMIRKKTSLGDLVILPESAGYFPGVSTTELVFSDSVTARATLIKSSNAYAQITWPALESLRYEHTNMLKQEDVKSRIVNILTNE